MAGIDYNILLQSKGPDWGQAMRDGMSMGQQMNQMKTQKQDQERKAAIDDAYRSSYTKGADGKMVFDQNSALSKLAGIQGAGQQTFQAQQDFQQMDQQKQKQDLEKKLQNVQLMGQLIGGANDQNSWMAARGKAQGMGMDVSQVPEFYDPGVKRQMQYSTMTAAQQLNYELDQQKLASAGADRREARDERRFQAGIKMDEKMQGLKTPYGLANTEDDAKKLKEAHEAKANFDNKLDQMIKLREDKNGGAFWDREAVARGKQLSKDLLLEYKNMAKLGVLSKSDEDIINAIIPEDPLEYNSVLSGATGQDPTLARLKSFKSDSDKDFNTKVGTRTRAGINKSMSPQGSPMQRPIEPIQMTPQDQEAVSWAKQNPNAPQAQEIMKMFGNFGGMGGF